MDTTPSWSRKVPAPLTAGLAAAVALIVAVPVSGAPAATAAPAARATLSLDGPAFRQAHKAGVRVTAKSGATTKAAAVRLPVTATVVDAGAAVGLRGTIVLRAGKRSTAISRLRVNVRSSRAVTVTGTIAGGAVTVFTGTAPKKGFALDSTAGTAAFAGTPLALSRGAAKAVRTRLKLRRTPTGRFATLVLTAGPLGGGGTTTSGPGGTPGTGSTPGTGTTPTPGPGDPPIASGPITDEAPPLARPDTAVAISTATVRWRVRDSWIQYIAGGNPSGVTGTSALAGATGDPALQQGCSSDGTVNTAALTYQFAFPFTAGWYDPVSGKASLSFAGGVNFRYPSHGIDLTTSTPEIQLDGAASKLVFVFSGTGSTNLGGKRSALTDLQVGAPPFPKACGSDVAPAQSANPSVTGTTHVYERIPGVIPAGTGSSVFAGFYSAGAPFGWLSVTFTTAS